MARKFFYVCAGLLMLAAAYHLGAERAQAQTGGTFVAMASSTANGYLLTLTATGDVYASTDGTGNTWHFVRNIVAGGAVSAQPQTWGQLKARYR